MRRIPNTIHFQELDIGKRKKNVALNLITQLACPNPSTYSCVVNNWFKIMHTFCGLNNVLLNESQWLFPGTPLS